MISNKLYINVYSYGPQLFSVIVMGCISAKGWRTGEDGKEHCVYNDDTNACNYGVGISVIAFIAAIAFIAGEYLFEQMSSVKTRKHYVLADMGFSGKFLVYDLFFLVPDDMKDVL